MTNSYHFITNWRIAGRREVVYDIVRDALHYPEWWSKVYLSVEELEHGAENEVGRRFCLHTKGWLPYTLRWEALTTQADPPNRLVIQAFGDFDGRGIWSVKQNGDFVDVTFDWKLTAEKPLLKHLSFLLKPLFSANHRWAMEQGRRGLQSEIKRRSALERCPK